jgi:glycosyltransferase
MMKISIITATFNSEKSLCYSLDSLFNQDYKNIECIIIDGDSKDSTLGIIKKYQSNYNNIHLVSEPDEGIYDALNKGIGLASGKIIAIYANARLAALPIKTEASYKRVSRLFSFRSVAD